MEKTAVDYFISELKKMNIQIAKSDLPKLLDVIKDTRLKFKEQLESAYFTESDIKNRKSFNAYYTGKFLKDDGK